MESAKYRNRLSMRLNDLKQVVDCSNAMVSDGGSSSSSSLTAMPLHRWQHSRLQRVIVEFLLQKELFQSAQSLIDHFNLTVCEEFLFEYQFSGLLIFCRIMWIWNCMKKLREFASLY